MEKWARWHKALKGQEEDVKLEVVLAELLENGHLSLDELFVMPNGGFHRAISEDIQNLSGPHMTKMDLRRAIVEINRPGIYDGLPEALFHQNLNAKPNKTVGDVKSDIVYNNEVERKARLFFAPLDNELILTRLEVERNERKMTADILKASKTRGLKKFWEIPSFFEEEEQGKLILLLPLAYRIAGDLEAAAQAMHLVLNVDVSIDKEIIQKPPPENSDFRALGGSQLGIHTVTAGLEAMDDGHLKITLGPMAKKTAALYANGQAGFRKLSYLADYFIPADMHYSLDILLFKEDQHLALDKAGGITRLGVTTYLN